MRLNLSLPEITLPTPVVSHTTRKNMMHFHRFGLLLATLVLTAPAMAGEDLSGKDLPGYVGTNKTLDESSFEDAILKAAKFDGASLKKTNFKHADLTDVTFTDADLTEADFRKARLTNTNMWGATMNKANFEGADLAPARFMKNKLREANLRNIKSIGIVSDLDFYKADLRGANLSGMNDVSKASNFQKAMYDKKTRWPKGFDVEGSGAVLVESPEETDPAADAKQLAKDFAKLDLNDDGRITGSEMKGIEDYDVDNNKRISLEEFIDGRTKK